MNRLRFLKNDVHGDSKTIFEKVVGGFFAKKEKHVAVDPASTQNVAPQTTGTVAPNNPRDEQQERLNRLVQYAQSITANIPPGQPNGVVLDFSPPTFNVETNISGTYLPQNSFVGRTITEETIRQIVRDELRRNEIENRTREAYRLANQTISPPSPNVFTSEPSPFLSARRRRAM
jgi:hypothetical protein